MFTEQETAKKSSMSKPVQRKQNNSSSLALKDNRATSALQRKANQTGLPDNLKSGMENLSGMNLDHVKVHYNSSKPATVQAHAYTQGGDIHLASGQEKHLPHELGHVVQQMKGRVKATTSVGGIAVNDDSTLENDATQMGNHALQRRVTSDVTETSISSVGGVSSKPVVIQREMIQVNRLLQHYAQITGRRTPATVGPYSNWSQIQALSDGTTFTEGQLKKLRMAFQDFDTMGNRKNFKDRTGASVVSADSTDSNIPQERAREILASVKSGPNKSTPHYNILNLLRIRILRKLGNDSLTQFWKGAHIVFKDNGSVYQQLLALGGPIAAKKANGSIKNKTEFAGSTSSNYFGWGASTQEQRRGSMMARRPGTDFRETSHYPSTVGGPPQYGVDMPEAIGGHLLFGLTPDGDTFVQTEGAGFQNFNQGFTQHLKGFATVKGAMQMPVPNMSMRGGWNPIPRVGLNWKGSPKGTQTGMAGYSRHSEADGVQSEIREHDNGNFADFLSKIV
ncbi:DUF4157 domain-containing protein [Vibrio maritimus]